MRAGTTNTMKPAERCQDNQLQYLHTVCLTDEQDLQKQSSPSEGNIDLVSVISFNLVQQNTFQCPLFIISKKKFFSSKIDFYYLSDHIFIYLPLDVFIVFIGIKMWFKRWELVHTLGIFILFLLSSFPSPGKCENSKIMYLSSNICICI